MQNNPYLYKKHSRLLAALSLGAALAAPGFVIAAGSTEMGHLAPVIDGRTDALTGHHTAFGQTLQNVLPNRTAVTDAAPRVLVAQSSSEAAALNLRISQLEEQLRSLTGQVEGLQFQMTQFQTLLERMQEDNDARFSALEGGAGLGKTEAAPQAGGAMPSGGEPQLVDPAPAGAQPLDLTGQAQDQEPLTLGSPEQPLGELSEQDLANGLGAPLDFTVDAGGMVTDADANAQYQAGYEAAVRGEYDFAEDQFRQFIALFPEHPQAPEATNWLGEVLIQQAAYDEAADILLTGFQSYPNSSRAPDMLLKLGVALSGAGEVETACRTFGEVQNRYPGQPQGFQARLSEEMARAGC